MSPFALFLAIICCYGTLSQASRVTLPGYKTKKETDEGSLPAEIVHKLEKVRKRGISWLLSQATEDFGWPSDDTPRVVVSLASSVEDWPAQNDLVARLIVKQLEIELLEKIQRREIESLTPAKVALFALAIGATCRDPHNFFGHNLIASLDKHHNDQDFPGFPQTFGYSFTSLVSCLAGSHQHSKQRIKHLLQLSNDGHLQKDTQGIALILMALECIRHRKKGEILSHHMHEPLERIAVQQERDGSFGNIHTTAIAVQALAASADLKLSWNKTSAALAFINSQEPNGSWDPNSKGQHDSSTSTLVGATTESVVALSALLNGLGILGLTKGRCNSIRKHRKHKASISIPNFKDAAEEPLHPHLQENVVNKAKLIGSNNFTIHTNSGLIYASNATTTDSLQVFSTATYKYETDATPSSVTSPGLGQMNKLNIVPVRYWLWIGPHPVTAIKRNVTLQVPVNTTFYSVMQQAAELASEYEFSSKTWPTGHYIDSIAAQHEPPVGSNYWVLYVLRSDPNPQNPPESNLVAPTGVDDLRIGENQVYLFWYKAL